MSMANFDPQQRFRGRLARTILLVLLPLSLLPLLLVGSAAYFRSYSILREQTINQLSSIVDVQSSLNAERMLAKETFIQSLPDQEIFTGILNTILTMPPEDEAFDRMRMQLIFEYQNIANNFITNNKIGSFDDLLILDPEAKIVVSTNAEWQGLILIRGAAFTDLVGKEASVTLYNASPLDRNRLFTFTSAPFVNPDGQVVATLIGVTESDQPLQVLDTIQTGFPQSKAYFFTKDGFFVGQNEEGNDLTALQMPSENGQILTSLLSSEARGGSLDFESINNRPVIGFTKWLPKMNSGLVVEVPREAITEPLSSLSSYIISLLVISMLVIGLLIWWGTNRLVKPLLSLAETTRHFAEGDWRKRSTVNRNDEIGLLAYSFNHMAEELSSVYRFLEGKVEERTRQMRIAAEVAQAVTSSPNLQELLERTTSSIVERFGYYDSSIFLIDDSGKQAVLIEHAGASRQRSAKEEIKFEVGSRSMVGWVTQNNQPRMAADVSQDPFYAKDELLSETHSEAVVPIAIGSRVLGALDVQSKDVDAFSNEDMAVMLTLANQIATAIQNIRLLEGTQINLEEASLLYNASRQIAKAENEAEVFQVVMNALHQTSFITAILFQDEHDWRFFGNSNEPHDDFDFYSAVRLKINQEELEGILHSESPTTVIDMANSSLLPNELLEVIKGWDCKTLAFVSAYSGEHFSAIFIIGSPQEGSITNTSMQPFASLAELTSTTLEKIQARRSMEQRIAELQTLSVTGQVVAVGSNLDELYRTLHTQIKNLMGEVNFLIALYDSKNQQIEVPFMYDGIEIQSVPPFPLGEGATSILIRSKQPLLIAQNTEERMKELGAKFMGGPAKSWLGVPLLVSGEPVGAIVVQDLEHEGRFGQDDLRILNALGAQVAAVIHNARLLEQTQKQAERERSLNEIVGKIRASTDMETIVATTATELARILGARRAEIEVGTVQHIEPVLPENGNGNGHHSNTESGGQAE